jgi:hypothetical protein
MFFTVFGSPGIVLLWVAVLRLYLLTFNEFRTYARNTLIQGLLHAVAYAKYVQVQYLSEEGEVLVNNTPSPDHQSRAMGQSYATPIGNKVYEPRRTPRSTQKQDPTPYAVRRIRIETRGSDPIQDSGDGKPEGRLNGVDKPETPAPLIAEPVSKTSLALRKQNPRGPRVKTDSHGPLRRTEKSDTFAPPPRQEARQPSEGQTFQSHAGEQGPLGNEATDSEVPDKVQAHLCWRSALFKCLHHVMLTDPGEEVPQGLSFLCSTPSLSNALERPFRTTKITNAIWKYMIGQSVLL